MKNPPRRLHLTDLRNINGKCNDNSSAFKSEMDVSGIPQTGAPWPQTKRPIFGKRRFGQIDAKVQMYIESKNPPVRDGSSDLLNSKGRCNDNSSTFEPNVDVSGDLHAASPQPQRKRPLLRHFSNFR